MRRTFAIAAAAALALCLAAPLAACSGTSGGDAPSQDGGGQAAGSFDIASCSTLGDLLAAGENNSSSWSDTHYLCVVDVDGQPIRAVVELTPEASEQFNALDFVDPDYDQKLLEILGPLPLLEIEDLSSERLSDDEMQALIGKTGQELLDDGFACVAFTMYGGEQTIADMDKGSCQYWVTFDGTITEAQAEADDGGACIADYKVSAVEYAGVSNEVLDPGVYD